MNGANETLASSMMIMRMRNQERKCIMPHAWRMATMKVLRIALPIKYVEEIWTDISEHAYTIGKWN